MELDMLSSALNFLGKKVELTAEEKPATRRMNSENERLMLDKFEKWKTQMNS